MTILGPNDPRAMSRDDPRLYHPKGKTLPAQIEDVAEWMMERMTEEELAEFEKALNSKPPKGKKTK